MSTEADPRTTARRVAELLTTGDYVSVAAMLDEPMQAGLPVSKLRGAWTGMSQGRLGQGPMSVGGAITTVVVPVSSEAGTVLVQVAVNADGSVGGLYFK